jgi:pilus assembly protein Flp/PilA
MEGLVRHERLSWPTLESLQLEDMKLKSLILFVCTNSHDLLSRDDGQDLVEYALIITLIALSAVAGIGHVATAVNTVFSKISTTLA